MSGRKKDAVWNSFKEIKSESRKGVRAKCNYCDKVLEGQVSRMKYHLTKCSVSEEENLDNTSK